MKRRIIPVLIFGFAAAFFAAPAAWAGEGVSADKREDVLSQADALAKGGQKEKALSMLESFLKEHPDNTEAQLLYARTLGWSGEHDRAAAVYRAVIEKEPRNAEAHAGLARVLSWKGDYAGSEEAYRRSLAMEPGAADTRMGLARTLWWKGDVEASLGELSEVISREPGNDEALGLERRLRQEKGPYLRTAFVSSSDSDESKMHFYQTTFANTFGQRDHRFEFSYKHLDASLPGRSARATHFEAKDSIRLQKATLTPRLSLVSLDSTVADTAYLTEGLSLSVPASKATVFSAAYSRYPMLDTARLIENDIRVREVYLGLMHDIKRATLSAAATSASYSDGNSRYDLAAGLAVNVMDSPRVVAGLTSEYRDFSESKANGYFNPPNIFTNSVYVDASGPLWRQLFFRAKAALGVQSLEGKSESTSSLQASFEWAVSRELWLDAGYKFSRSALESASGFRFNEFRAGFNFLF